MQRPDWAGRHRLSESRPVVVVGAGVAGLVCALELAGRGVPTLVLEAADRPGGKMRRATLAAGSAGVRPVGGSDDGSSLAFDAGPTVLTMRWVFEEIFAAAGVDFNAAVPTQPAQVLARHAWSEDERLDLHATPSASAAAIAELCGAAEGRRFLEFCAAARATYRSLVDSFIRAQRPSMAGLVARIAAHHPAGLLAVRPFETLWHALGRHFTDPRLQQLFGRYATYCGSSPFEAPATLMLVAHVEQSGVWLVEGGMFRIAEALERAVRAHGARLRYGARVVGIDVDGNGASGVELAGGEVLAAGAVVVNADAAGLAQGRLGAAGARAAAGADRLPRSLSAVTWMLQAPTQGFPLLRHNVFFSSDYRAEFDALFRRRVLPEQATIYLCAQDRTAGSGPRGGDPPAAPSPTAQAKTEGHGAERLLCLINAPADGDRAAPSLSAAQVDAAEARVFATLARMGLQIDQARAILQRTTPVEFEQLYPGSGGALYGSATHGPRASFLRPGSASAIPGLFLAGGSAHPGPGVPMAALSGRLAAQRILATR